MKTYPECYECLVRQALTAAQLAGADEPLQFEVLNRVFGVLQKADMAVSPSETSYYTNQVMWEITGCDDSYHTSKEASTKQALALYPQLKEMVSKSADPRDTALRLSIAGNVIDMVMAETYDLTGAIEQSLTHAFAIDHRAALWAVIDEAETILYLADNAGETIFDRVLIEAVGVPVLYGVKGGPILNDATREDASAAGVNHTAAIIDTGVRTPGTVLHLCSPEFRAIYDAADVIIAKGQANYETLSDGDPRVFHLLQVKCSVISRAMGVPAGSMVVGQSVNISHAPETE